MRQKTRSYNLLCPIARALDHVGDRWTLLILRDLHAGPARFKDLQAGLTGIASNLLTERLNALEASGLLKKQEAETGASFYQLTERGAQTRDLIFELARFGSRMPRPAKVKRPGNLRTVAVALGTACSRVATAAHGFEATLMIDGEAFCVTAGDGAATVRAGAAAAPDVTMTTSYEPMMAFADGDMAADEFAANHVQLEVKKPGKEAELFDLLSRAMQEFD